MARPATCALVLAATLSGCTDESLPVAPGIPVPLSISFQIAQTGGGVMEAYDRTDMLFVRFRSGNEVRFENEVAFDPTGDESTVPIQVPLRGARETLDLELELRMSDEAIFRGGGTAELTAGIGSAVNVTLDPVIAGISCAGDPVAFTAYNQTMRFRGIALFATGDTIPDAVLAWNSGNGTVATVDDEGDVTSVGDGQALITCSVDGFSDTRSAQVLALVSSLAIAPASATVSVGATIPFAASLRDSGGNAITTPRQVIWDSQDTEIATVDPAGVATGVGRGATYIRASSGTAVDSALVTVQAPPIARTVGATVPGLQASLSGLVNPQGLATQAWFEWGTNPSLAGAQQTQAQSVGSGTADVAINETLVGLAPGTTYYFRAAGSNPAGTSRGQILSFTTPVPPAVQTIGSAVLDAREVELAGLVNPQGSGTTVWFEWGTDPTLATSQATQPISVGAGTADVSFTDFPSGLVDATTYYFRAVASSGGGTVFGGILSFMTQAPPTVQTTGAIVLPLGGESDVDLLGTVNPEGTQAAAWFEIGLDPNLSDAVRTSAQAIGAGTVDVDIRDPFFGLASDTTYYFRAAASNSVGTTFGAILSFRTPGPPVVETLDANPAEFSAELRGLVNPSLRATDAWFEWDFDPFLSEPFQSSRQTLPAGDKDVAVGEVAANLVSDTIYYFRVVANNEAGRTYGATVAFRTLPADVGLNGPVQILALSSRSTDLLRPNFPDEGSGTMQAGIRAEGGARVQIRTGHRVVQAEPRDR